MKLTFLAAFICAATPAFAAPVSVIVVGPDGKPLAGAVISIVEGKYPSNGAATPRDIAGKNGRFVFDWNGTFADKDAPIPYDERQFVYVRAQSPGLTTQMLTLNKTETTIRLQPARSWGGLVRDGADKPVAGVRVELKSWSANGKDERDEDDTNAPESIGFSPLIDAWKVSAQTDAQGRWQLDDLPREASATIGIADARFVKKSFDLKIGAVDAPPLFVRAGATLTGILLRPDGAPLADTKVGVGWNEGGETRTDAQGRFTLAGVEPGEVTLQSGNNYWADAGEKKPDYLVPPREKVTAVAGQTTDVGEWKAVVGLSVSGQIVDEATKEPVKGARLNFYNGTMFMSDEQGKIDGRILPAKLRQGLGMMGSVYAKNYVQSQLAQQTLKPDSTTLDLGTIALARGTVMSGTVRVEGETGKTIAGLPSLQLRGRSDSGYISLWDGKTEFNTNALKSGNYTVQLDNGKDKNSAWEIVSPQKISVPPLTATPDAAPKKGAPIEIVLKRLAPTIPLLGVITGRVADAAGNALGGAAVTVRLRAGNSYTSSETLTDGDGAFEIGRSAPGSYYFAADSVEILKIERPGYLWASQPKIETKNGETTIGNLTMKKRGAVFAGRVVGANGQGAAGAWVGVLEARDYPLVQTGADGQFEMADLPAEKFTVIGAGADSFGRALADADAQNFVLTLAPNPASDREQLADRALEGTVDLGNAQQYGKYLDAARNLDVIGRIEKGQRPYNAQNFAQKLERSNPQEFLRFAPDLMKMLAESQQQSLQARVFALRAASDEADDRIAANAWLDEQKAEKREINAASVTRLLEMAIVADKLKREDAASWLDYAAAIAAQLKGGAGGNSRVWGASLAQIGARAMPPFVEEMKAPAEFDFWQGASVAFVRAGDVAASRAALARAEVLAQTPELVEQGKKQNWNNPATQLEQTRRSVALALAETDAKAALEIMPANGDDWGRAEGLLAIADRAVAAKDRETAEKVLGQIGELKLGNVEKFALAASLAQELDPQLAAPLWADALARTMPTGKDNFDLNRASVGMWAFYHARLDAARSRVLIEREWNWRLPAAVKTKNEEYSSDGYILSQLEMGMAAVDPFRALEMRDEARAQTGKPGAPATAEVGLAAAILATPKQRARFGADSRF